MSSAVIELAEVVAGYPHRPVLDGLSLVLEAGERVALTGPNGAGKTTLLRVITGQLPVRCGRVLLAGCPVGSMPAAERARTVAVVPQELSTPMSFTVEELVTMGRTATLSRWARPAARELQAVERAMEYADVAALRREPFDALSGGEKQRVAIALALAQEPRILLLDEPTAHLDLHHRFEILALIERLNEERGMTVLMISHDLNLAAESCRRLLMLHRGRLAADGPPAEVLTEEHLAAMYPVRMRVLRHPDDDTISIHPVRN